MKIGPKFKICRRLGERVFPKAQGVKFSISGTGQGDKGKGGKGFSRPKPLTDFGRQLIEKQKARYTYCITEKQFSNYVKRIREKSGADKTIDLYRTLESRLDNVVFRLGLANSRLFARQLVTHGHVTVNGRKVNIPSSEVKAGDRIGIRGGSKEIGPFKNLEEKLKNYQRPEWLILDDKTGDWQIKNLPMTNAQEMNLNFGAILEFYSRG